MNEAEGEPIVLATLKGPAGNIFMFTDDVGFGETE